MESCAVFMDGSATGLVQDLEVQQSLKELLMGRQSRMVSDTALRR